MYKYAYETISCNLEGWGLGAMSIVLMNIVLLLTKELHKDGDMLDIFL